MIGNHVNFHTELTGLGKMESRLVWELVSLKLCRIIAKPCLDSSQAMHSTTSITEGKVTTGARVIWSLDKNDSKNGISPTFDKWITASREICYKQDKKNRFDPMQQDEILQTGIVVNWQHGKMSTAAQ